MIAIFLECTLIPQVARWQRVDGTHPARRRGLRLESLAYIAYNALRMAFPVPSHLPRKAVSQDISSRILSKISSATVKTLNADLAASWVTELDEAILESKVHSPGLTCTTFVY